ncbi:hypothetical protein LOK46_10615 [Methylobacterium sp. NMS14P]|uniref:hypothetical protein n=1 Tax=Methylobacterium sp. NMS14P TaxID=2894310 RepID=UPI002358DAB9|nr:hypothetical protein [Methylobacterium sp. NMS14P]WCS27242.1 hypothetical protein LOK46_10615 [Methylobacterium sp. NMS14P]
MSDIIRVGSRLHTAIRITEPMENIEKPGEAGPLRSHVIAGAPHDGGEAVTEGVPADLYRAWLKANPLHPAVQGELLREMGDEEPSEPSYGFQPGLDAITGDKDEKNLASKGSTVGGDAPVSATDMAATSDAPVDNSPRSQTLLDGGPSANAVKDASAGKKRHA